MIDVLKLLEDGHTILAEERAESEKVKAGQLRVGSAGCVGGDNQIYGNCHRKSLARLLGSDEQKDLSTRIMFQAGETNEISWMEVLTKSWTGKIRCEEEIPVEFSIGETRITGRPDVVLCDGEGNPQYVLELKGVFGISTASSVSKGVPKSDNLVQAAAYMMLLKVPGALCYTSRSYVQVGATKLKPFYKIFYLQWTDGFLEYRADDQNDFTRTVITEQGIRDYYAMVLEMKATSMLGPRPSELSATGDKLKYGPCGLCYLAKNCDRNENSYTDWVNALVTNT